MRPGSIRKVIVVGLDGLEPRIVDRLFEAGQLPHLARIRELGGYARVRTTYPAQTPVAWSSFATGLNPGGHGIFDFLRRDPQTYFPTLALNRYEQKNMFTAPMAVNLRRGPAVWDVLAQAGLPAVVLRCPCTFPPREIEGRMLAGVGVPDLRGGLGTSTYYTTCEGVVAQEGEQVVQVRPGPDGNIQTHLVGPRDPRRKADWRFDLTLGLDGPDREVVVRCAGEPPVLALPERRWSDWLRVRFKTGLGQSVRGMVRFYLIQREPGLELFASPLNFDADAPLFPISWPPEYAAELARRLGSFYTTGMVEEHGGLNNGRIDEEAFLAQCEGVMRERERMLLHELDRQGHGLIFCLFDTPDRLQHMFWRFLEPDHPAHRGELRPDLAQVIDQHYRACDDVVGRVLAHVDDRTLLIVLSDHGMTSFQRGVDLNTWLHSHGFLALRAGVSPGPEAGDFFRGADWSHTKAYALGLGGIYLNLKGREAQGIVDENEADGIASAIARGLTGLEDPRRGAVAIRGVMTRAQLYRGPCAHEAPDLLVNCAAGYRVSWSTPLGGMAESLFTDNVKRWSGDHTVDPELVPGVLFMNRPFRPQASLIDLAPTILAALGAPKGSLMEGESLLG